MAHTGHCFCGQAQYRIDAEPVGARTCWCRDCQYIACGSASNNVLFPADSVQFEGTISTIEKIAASGRRIERGFCPECGSQIYARTMDAPAVPIRIRAGTLDNPELMAPRDVIWASSAPGWAVIDPDLPAFPEQPPAPPKAD